jgi:hypothetical protein
LKREGENESAFKPLNFPKHANASSSLEPGKVQRRRDNELSCTSSAKMRRNLLFILQFWNAAAPSEEQSRSLGKRRGNVAPHDGLLILESCDSKMGDSIV